MTALSRRLARLVFPAMLVFFASIVASCGDEEKDSPEQEEETEEESDQATAEKTAKLFARDLLAGKTVDCQSRYFIGNRLQDLGLSESDAAANCFSFKTDLGHAMYTSLATSGATFAGFSATEQSWLTDGLNALRDAEVSLSDNKGFPINRMVQVDGSWYIVYLLNPGGSVPR